MSKYFKTAYWITLEVLDRKRKFYRANAHALKKKRVIRVLAFDGGRLRLSHDHITTQGDSMRGAIGCYLTHLAVIGRITEQKENALVLEDDVVLCDDFQEKLDEEMPSMPENWDIIRLGGTSVHIGGTEAYLVRASSAAKIESFLQERDLPVDAAFSKLYKEKKLVIGVTKQKLSIQTSPDEKFSSTVAEHPSTDPNRSFSGEGEDIFMRQYFAGHKGRFLDIGAFDGVTNSNTRTLYLNGWKGVMVEPDPFAFVRLNTIYRNTNQIRTLCACVRAIRGIKTFHLCQGQYGTSDEKAFEDLLKSKELYHGYLHAPALTPADLVCEYGNEFDFINLSSVGADLEILEHYELFEKSRMLCLNKDAPGKMPDRAYTEKLVAAADNLGFSQVAFETGQKLLLTI